MDPAWERCKAKRRTVMARRFAFQVRLISHKSHESKIYRFGYICDLFHTSTRQNLRQSNVIRPQLWTESTRLDQKS